MIYEAADFIFQPPIEVAFARRVLIKPGASYPRPHPVTTSRQTLAAVIAGIRKVSDADILLLEGSASGEPEQFIYRELGYDFPRTVMLDVAKCVPLEVENPLPKSFALSTFWVPNVILSCDFLITIAPFQIVAGSGNFSIKNLLGLLPAAKYLGEMRDFPGFWQRLGINNVVADLYFTLPFDLGIIDGRKKLISSGDPVQGEIEDYGKIFAGPPFEVDCEAAQAAGVEAEYLRLIERAKADQPTWIENIRGNYG